MVSAHPSTSGYQDKPGEPHKDVASPTTYVIVFVALVVLTIVTAVCSQLPLGRWEFVVALGIASLKAALVTLIFMHLIHMGRLNWVIVSAGAFWLGLFFVLIMADYLTRSWYSIVASPRTAVQTLTEVEAEFEAHHPGAADVLPGSQIP